MASRYASAAALLVVVAVAAVFQATSAAFLMPEGKFCLLQTSDGFEWSSIRDLDPCYTTVDRFCSRYIPHIYTG